MKGERIVTYARVSTAEQVQTGTSLADQRRRLAAAVTARAAVLAAHVEDAGISGAKVDRPGLDQVRSLVSSGEVDIVMATKIDRVSRSAVGLLNLVEELRSHACDLVLIDEGLDTSTPAGDLTSGVLGVIGGWERRRIAERTKQGRRAAAEVEGRFVGSTPPFGYQVVAAPDGRGKRLAINEASAATIHAIFDRLIEAGDPPRKVADDLNANGLTPARSNLWTAVSVSRWAGLPGPLRAASGTWRFTDVDVPIPAILTPEQTAAWRRWQLARTSPQRPRGPYLLSGILCMPCGGGAMGRTAGAQRSTYSCRHHYLPLHDPQRHGACVNVAVDVVDAAVRHQIEEILATPAVLTAMAEQRLGRGEQPAAKLAALNEELRNVESHIAQDSALFRAEGFTGTALLSVLAPLKDQHRELELKIRATHRYASATARARSGSELEELVAMLRHGLTTLDFVTTRALLLTLDARASIETYSRCQTCHGTGYLSLAPGQGRRWPKNCPACLNGLNPNLTIELDDVIAVAIAHQLPRQPPQAAS